MAQRHTAFETATEVWQQLVKTIERVKDQHKNEKDDLENLAALDVAWGRLNLLALELHIPHGESVCGRDQDEFRRLLLDCNSAAPPLKVEKSKSWVLLNKPRGDRAVLEPFVKHLMESCCRLESHLSETQLKSYRQAFRGLGLCQLSQKNHSQIDALLYTLIAFQHDNAFQQELKPLAHIRRSLLQYRETYNNSAMLKAVVPAQGYALLDDDLECFTDDDQTYGQLRISRDSITSVYVEWRQIDAESWEVTRRYQQMQDLASVLASDHVGILKTLPCIGVVCKRQERGVFRCGFVYNHPTSQKRSSHQNLQTLYSLLNSSFRPSLSARLRLALDIATGVLHLHTVGWLHKEIRSSNVMFFPDTPSQRTLKHARLMGLTYARSWNTGRTVISDKTPNQFDLWRHPQYQTTKSQRDYCKVFDTYSLGLVLFEIGRWKALDKLFADLQTCSEDVVQVSTFGSRIQERDSVPDLWRDLMYHAGETFAGVVHACLNQTERVSPKQDHLDYLLQNVVLVLERLSLNI